MVSEIFDFQSRVNCSLIIRCNPGVSSCKVKVFHCSGLIKCLFSFLR